MTTSPNDVAILRDVNGKPIPQIWDSDAGEFVAYEGENVIIDADGNKLAINADGSIDVSGVATETTIDAIKDAVEATLSSKIVDSAGVNELSVNADGSIDVDGVATETTLDAVKTAVEGTVDVLGSIKEYQWLSSESGPTLAAADRAFGVEVNINTHKIVMHYWDGTAWQEVAD